MRTTMASMIIFFTITLLLCQTIVYGFISNHRIVPTTLSTPPSTTINLPKNGNDLMILCSKSLHHQEQQQQEEQQQEQQQQYCRRNFLSKTTATTTTAAIIASAMMTMMTIPMKSAMARLEPINRPELLPKESGKNIIQIEKFLTSGQVRRLEDLLQKLEIDTGYRLRILCQSYPNTPGLAITNYWDLGKEGQKDDKYVVLVVDQFGGKGNALNFNVGDGVKFALPNVFWTRLQSKYGSTFYVRDNGIDIAIVNAIEAIISCLRSEDQYCVNVPDEGLSLKSLGM